MIFLAIEPEEGKNGKIDELTMRMRKRKKKMKVLRKEKQ
jgi:hypothetical protein